MPFAVMPDRQATIELVYELPDELPDELQAELIETRTDISKDNPEAGTGEALAFSRPLLEAGPDMAKAEAQPAELPIIEILSSTQADADKDEREVQIIDRPAPVQTARITDPEQSASIPVNIAAASPGRNTEVRQIQAEPPSAPMLYSGKILGASVRPDISNAPARQDRSQSQKMSSCAGGTQGASEKNKINQQDDNKRVTISALLGGGVIYQAIRQQQQLTISALLGSAFVNSNSPTVNQLLDMHATSPDDSECAVQ